MQEDEINRLLQRGKEEHHLIIKTILVLSNLVKDNSFLLVEL